MDKTELISGILGIVFFVVLIIYSVISSNFTLYLHLFLLITGLIISVLMINKFTKSANPLKSKILFSVVMSFLVFFSIIFFWFLGNHSSIDEKGLLTVLLIIPSAILFGVVSIIVGVILSIKRKARKDSGYPKLFLSIITAVSIVLLVLFFYNTMISGLAVALGGDNLCYITISPSDSGSYMFNARIQPSCASRVGRITGDENICKDIREASYKDMCYSWVIIKRKDVKICFDSPQPFDISVRCGTAFRRLENEIYDILKDPSHPDVVYAVKATPSLGIFYDEAAEAKYIPLIKNIVKEGNLDAKKEALELLFRWTEGNTLEVEKEMIRNEILPLIEGQSGLQEYADKADFRLSAYIVQ